jgi:hypothetical protein
MSHHEGLNATIEALNHVATAATELLARLPAAAAPAERAALRAEIEARLDDLQADLRRRHGLSERHAADVLARALAHIGEIARAGASLR